MDGQGSSDYTDQPGFTQTVVEKSQTRPYLNQINKTPEKQVPNRLYKYLDSKTQEKSPTSKNLAAQAQQTQQLGNVTKQDALFSSAGLEVDRDLLEHRKKVQNRFSPFKRDTGPQGDFDLVLTTETKTAGTDADKYSKYNQKVLAEAEIFRKHQVVVILIL